MYETICKDFDTSSKLVKTLKTLQFRASCPGFILGHFLIFCVRLKLALFSEPLLSETDRFTKTDTKIGEAFATNKIIYSD